MQVDLNIVIIFGSLLLSLILGLLYAASQQVLRHRACARNAEQDPSRSVGQSELEELMRKTVLDAVRPLERRIAALEAENEALHAALGRKVRGAFSGETREVLSGSSEVELEWDLADESNRGRVR